MRRARQLSFPLACALAASAASALAGCTAAELATVAQVLVAADGKGGTAGGPSGGGSTSGGGATAGGGATPGGDTAGGAMGAVPGLPGLPGPAGGAVGVPAGQDVASAVAMLNEVRALAKLPPVALDDEMSRACERHIAYMIENHGHPALEGLGAHKEDPSLPGYTPEGAKAGERSDIAFIPPTGAVVGWLASLYHRTPMLRPATRKVGFASRPNPNGFHVTLLMFDDASEAPPGAYPVAFPADGQTRVPVVMGPEIPNPVPGGGYGKAGYPITLNFADDEVKVARAVVTTADGADVPVHLSTPEDPATDFPQGGAVCLIPQARLAYGTTYAVAIEAAADGEAARTWRWRFTTAPEGDPVANGPMAGSVGDAGAGIDWDDYAAE